ncbi:MULTISPECIES: hypothetical protein [unclassified Bradyrhizobium]|uniref:hypothetical protein n=1 Tax=unclassified Bradyrhizobium TaxID=2631580 RepID=UPI00247AF59C|nr:MULTISPECIES: hypothetical protein [unclassified Bradyrhizobium]WGR74231.1 hypothetical protein MTX24_15990 [Bradyrhizobium sp. ISRA426]WGR79066.1 hypothetical protein MTX21_01105 [Bradyrhizobium sp. ISRA430]WGR89470.1 hypothetical protein MTX25_16005 [Bradyrhizobium sp. ISRA432]
MTRSSATVSGKALIVICGIAAMPVASLAQGTGGTGSGGGVANAPAPPPGTNSLGTAQSSGPNAARGVTTGTGEGADAAVKTENEKLDKKMKSICRGC